MKRFAVIAVFSVAAAPAALAFHELDCGPFRTTSIDTATGESRCLETSPDAKEQFLRFRKLQQAQEKRIRDLQLRQRQRTKAKELEQQQRAAAQAQITIQEQNKQLFLNRRQTQNQRQSSLESERSQILQEGLFRQDQEAKQRNEQALRSNLLREQNLLEQKLELPRADLLDGQKAFIRRIEKDQQGQK